MRFVFKSVILTGLLFGLICSFASFGIYFLPVNTDVKDVLTLVLLLAGILASQLLLKIPEGESPFMKLWLTGFIAYGLFPVPLLVYFHMKGAPVKAQWPALFALGLGMCAGSAFLAMMRRNRLVKGSAGQKNPSKKKR